MIKRLLCCAVFSAFASAAFAGEALPQKHLFAPFIADPTQPSFGARYTGVVGSGNLAEVNMGDEFGIYAQDFNSGKLQFGIMGGVAARFDISKVTNDFQVADFSVAFPLDYKMDKLTLRAMYWHTSSHIGDDYIISHNLTPDQLSKHVTDDVRVYADYALCEHLRVYGGASYSFNMIPHTTKFYRVHTGAEASLVRGDKTYFAAGDFQSYQRMGWQPSFTTRLGVKKSGKTSAVSAYAEFFSGHLPYLGLMTETETHWGGGFIFQM